MTKHAGLWVRTPTKWRDDPRVQGVSVSARWLLLMGILTAKEDDTDGRLTPLMVAIAKRNVPKPNRAEQELIAAGLWVQDGDGTTGVTTEYWATWQETRAENEQRRGRDAKRKANQRKAAGKLPHNCRSGTSGNAPQMSHNCPTTEEEPEEEEEEEYNTPQSPPSKGGAVCVREKHPPKRRRREERPLPEPSAEALERAECWAEIVEDRDGPKYSPDTKRLFAAVFDLMAESSPCGWEDVDRVLDYLDSVRSSCGFGDPYVLDPWGRCGLTNAPKAKALEDHPFVRLLGSLLGNAKRLGGAD